MTRPSVAFLGLGAMGLRMALRLHSSGLDVVGWNRSAARRDDAHAHGLPVAATIGEAIEGRALVVTMLADPDAVRDVLLGPDGVERRASSGTLVIEMSTIDPATVQAVGAALGARGIELVDVPVSGTLGPAERGELVLLAGGDAGLLERARPVLDVLGKRVVHAGGLGSGAALKLVVNALGSYLCAGISNALVLAGHLGLERRTVLDAVLGGPFAPPVFAAKANRLLADDYDNPDFSMRLLAKDQRLVAHAAAEAGFRDDAHRMICQLVDDAVAHGDGEIDLYGLVREVARRQ
ncbi:MAG: NAD(P)-dependent oxidoreductase, partial [Deltaproteobacteria bacterium]|nr:NAD(P)-dependent oxidoreductase [Deltaproteobacteria bacterium]